ncbi:MAG: branched-chain amino acid ABC transporter permease LivH [Desulfocapsaceae bacterium]|nr:branched-chain amino acid ABC transporter permease LivH [Desulfocapsaceae bacterium]
MNESPMHYFIELFFSGLTRGAIYALIALGYTMVYGIIGLINFAHGEIYMIGAFTSYIVASVLSLYGYPLFATVIIAGAAAVVWSGAYGYTVERLAYRPLRRAPRLSPLISAIGMSILLQNYVFLAQTSDFISFPKLIPDLPFMDRYADYLGSSDVVILFTTLIVMGILTFIIRYTRIGKAMRATAQDSTMAMLVGINVNRVISATFVIGSGLAAIGGMLIAAHIGQINYYIGFLAGIKAFTAAVLGGIGSIPGAVLGSLVLGLTESFATGYVSSDYEDVFAFTLLVLILIFRPSGLLGKKESQKV